MDDKQCFLLSNTIRDEAFVKSTKEIYLDTADIKYFYYVINEFAKTRKTIESSLKQKQQWKKKTKGSMKSKSGLCWSQIPMLALGLMTLEFASDMAM